ncbi:hypothetical protein IPJ70_04275 [Candidatus Campbellbacteria bacterium]|nr:MAG: hypothetical protein IPJ70_04275 [Candidatus Campbellbacteria bacterium]
MAEALLSYALTTVARVKTRLSITVSTHDTILLYLINSVTDFIEGECNRRFKLAVWTNELYSMQGNSNGLLVLKQSPVSAVSYIQFRAGTKTNPNWTDFMADDWELLDDGASGIIEFHNAFVHGINNIRIAYTAGYKINFTNYGDGNTHNLPADLTDLTERLAIKLFKRREAEGKAREDFNGGSITWKDLLNPEDTETINKYRRVNFF